MYTYVIIGNSNNDNNDDNNNNDAKCVYIYIGRREEGGPEGGQEVLRVRRQSPRLQLQRHHLRKLQGFLQTERVQEQSKSCQSP